MREFNVIYSKGLSSGLRKAKENRRNVESLVKSDGMFPENGGLRSLDDLSRIDTSEITASFPYPQIFVLNKIILVCSATEIWEYIVGSGLVVKLSGLTEGITWSVADFHDYIVMVNGKEVVIRDSATKEFTTVNLNGLPVATSVANVNGQAVFTAPDTEVPSADI